MIFPYHDDNPTTRVPLVTLALIGFNAVSFLMVQREPPLQQQIIHIERGFVPARVAQLSDGKVVDVPLGVERRPILTPVGVKIAEKVHTHPLPADRQQIVTSWITAMFLHGGWMHLLGNMWFLWLFGNNVEDLLGHLPFAGLYFVGGLLAWAAHWAVLPAGDRMLMPVIGASGAVAAVLGAYAVRFPQANVRCLIFIVIFVTMIELPALAVLGIWFLAQVIDGVADLGHFSGGVAWWAHIGGFAAGALIMALIPRQPPPHLVRPGLRLEA